MWRAWGGIASLQLSLPVVWTEARRRGFTLDDLARWMAREPARLVGLSARKGEIAPGRDADLVVFDPGRDFFCRSAEAIPPSQGDSLRRADVWPGALRPPT